eukprot:365140-Chlamydomonas_euryale.AAC.5
MPAETASHSPDQHPPPLPHTSTALHRDIWQQRRRRRRQARAFVDAVALALGRVRREGAAAERLRHKVDHSDAVAVALQSTRKVWKLLCPEKPV